MTSTAPKGGVHRRAPQLPLEPASGRQPVCQGTQSTGKLGVSWMLCPAWSAMYRKPEAPCSCMVYTLALRGLPFHDCWAYVYTIKLHGTFGKGLLQHLAVRNLLWSRQDSRKAGVFGEGCWTAVSACWARSELKVSTAVNRRKAPRQDSIETACFAGLASRKQIPKWGPAWLPCDRRAFLGASAGIAGACDSDCFRRTSGAPE